MRQSRRIWRKDADETGMGSLPAARDLKLIDPKDYEDLAKRTIEVKRMLAGLIQKLKADC